MTGIPSSASSRAVPPLATSSKPRRRSSSANAVQAGLVVHGEEGAPHAAISSRTTSAEPVLDCPDACGSVRAVIVITGMGSCRARPRCRFPRRREESSRRSRVAPAASASSRARAGKRREQRRVHVQTTGEALEERPAKEPHEPAQTTSGAALGQPLRHAESRADRGPGSRRARRPRSGPRSCGPLERARARKVRRDRRDRDLRVDQACRLEPLPVRARRLRGPASRPRHPLPGPIVPIRGRRRERPRPARRRRSRSDVEHASQLLLGDAVGGQPAEDLGPLPGRRSRRLRGRPAARAQDSGDAAARDVRSARRRRGRGAHALVR